MDGRQHSVLERIGREWIVPFGPDVLARWRRRRATWFRTGSLVMFAVIAYHVWPSPGLSVGWMWVVYFVLLVDLLGVVAFSIWISRVRRRAIERDGRVCNHCGYDLRQTEEPGPCPECGKVFDVDELRAYWEYGWKK